MSIKWTKTKLIQLFKDLEQDLGARPTAEQFYADARTPSNMPIRQQFGNWTGFVKAMGLEPLPPVISPQAREASIKSRKGKKGGNNKGGKYVSKNGYVWLWRPEHPNARKSGYVHEHRMIMSDHLGRPLKSHENVHHKNGVRGDNRIENLELWVSTQPSGQRVSDLVTFAKEILEEYGNIFESPELLESE